MSNEQNWHNRVELSLDNRQIFLLFFASAVVIGLVFALGVVVGKRYQPETVIAGGASDPLAMIDQLGQDPEEDNLTFHETLSSDKPPEYVAAKVESPEAEEEGDAPAVDSEPEPRQKKKKELASSKSSTSPSQRPGQASPAVIDDSGKKRVAKAPKVDSEQVEDGSGGSYTLQLSSFQERAEADRFMEKLKGAGMSPYMTPTDIPGRGIWYRVRLGNYKTWENALEAKQKFERVQQIIAYVMKR